MQTSRPATIVLVGALFAFSFDTVSQAALFALTASQVSSVALGVAAAASFMLGMMAADGANGIWLASLLRNADRRARVATRIMGLAVAGLSLAVAALGAAKLLWPGVDAWTEGRELAIGLGVIGLVAASFGAAVVAARLRERRSLPQGAA
jgi:high-affinity nickel-transport protein